MQPRFWHAYGFFRIRQLQTTQLEHSIGQDNWQIRRSLPHWFYICMPTLLYNSLGRKTQPLNTSRQPIKIYTCGPTVYGRAHIGNLSSYLFADFLVRWLEEQHYEVEHAKNITDVGHLTQDDLDTGDDKMVKAALAQQTTVESIAQQYTDLYLQDEQDLQIREPEHRPKATDYIEEQIAFTNALIEKGHAYVVDGNVYFSIESFPRYGALSGNTIEDLRAGARIHVDEHKRHPADFLLWRTAQPDHLMQWASPWGQGYPGWHIECSAMAHATLGEQIDIHTGGEDNIFPHHESEIAQSESRFERPFAQLWMHRRHILVDGAKMSKSVGNVYTLDDIRAQGFHPLDFRMLVFSGHYRSKLDFSWDAMHQAQSVAQRLVRTYRRVIDTDTEPTHTHTASNRTKDISSTDTNNASNPTKAYGTLTPYWNRFERAMNDDLNTPEALAVVIEATKDINTQLDAQSEIAKHALAFMNRVDHVLRILTHYPVSATYSPEIQALIEERAAARAERNYERADQIREQLRSKGIELQDAA